MSTPPAKPAALVADLVPLTPAHAGCGEPVRDPVCDPVRDAVCERDHANPALDLATDSGRLIDAWVADRVGRLPPTERAALDRALPDWPARAATLIAEGLLAYVAIEMVAPDLAIAAASGRVGGHPGAADDDELTARLGAHLRDFIDYREQFAGAVPAPVVAARRA